MDSHSRNLDDTDYSLSQAHEGRAYGRHFGEAPKYGIGSGPSWVPKLSPKEKARRSRRSAGSASQPPLSHTPSSDGLFQYILLCKLHIKSRRVHTGASWASLFMWSSSKKTAAGLLRRVLQRRRASWGPSISLRHGKGCRATAAGRDGRTTKGTSASASIGALISPIGLNRVFGG